MWHLRETGAEYTRVWWGDLKERDHLKYLFVDWKIILKWTFEEWY
jgi:hypothetical protein